MEDMYEGEENWIDCEEEEEALQISTAVRHAIFQVLIAAIVLAILFWM